VQDGAFHARHELHDAGFANVLDEPVDDGVTKFAVGHLAAAETEARLHLVALGQEADGLVLFRLVVVLVHGDRELDFLDDDDLLLLAGGAFALFLLVEVAAVILDAADGRDSVGADFYQVEAAFAGDPQSLKRGQDSKLFAVLVDDADLARADTIVDANKGLGGSFIESDGTPPERVRAGLRVNPVRRRQANASLSIASVDCVGAWRRRDEAVGSYAVKRFSREGPETLRTARLPMNTSSTVRCALPCRSTNPTRCLEHISRSCGER